MPLAWAFFDTRAKLQLVMYNCPPKLLVLQSSHYDSSDKIRDRMPSLRMARLMIKKFGAPTFSATGLGEP